MTNAALGEYHLLALQKMGAVLGDRRAQQLLTSVLAEHQITLRTPDDLAWFSDELAKLGGFEGAVGAMLGLKATMLGGRRPAASSTPRRVTVGVERPAELELAVTGSLTGATSVQDAAQRLTTLIADRYTTVPLCRCYVVLPLDKLPTTEAAFARRFAAEKGAGSRIRSDTAVLTLLGSSGTDPAWCDRRRSKGHLAIPLLTSEFVRGAPMIAAMLSELHVDLRGFDSPGVVVRRFEGGGDGVFYVRDAAEATDPVGRRIIPATDFVRTHRIRTVFGMGGTCSDGTLAVVIVFTQETLARPLVESLAGAMQVFKEQTNTLLSAWRYFD